MYDEIYVSTRPYFAMNNIIAIERRLHDVDLRNPAIGELVGDEIGGAGNRLVRLMEAREAFGEFLLEV